MTLRWEGRVLHREVAVSSRPRIDSELVPALAHLTDAVVEEAVELERSDGREISCRAGCGSCCRQVVPVSPIEARYLSEMVAAFPPERRAAVDHRVEEIRGTLARADLLEPLRRLDRLPDAERRDLCVRYFRLRLACPFLVEERCSIHDERPLSCREYLVTSPPPDCRRPGEGRVARVPLPVSIAHRVSSFGETRRVMIPLVLAFAWVERHPVSRSQRHPGPELLAELLHAVNRT